MRKFVTLSIALFLSAFLSSIFHSNVFAQTPKPSSFGTPFIATFISPTNQSSVTDSKANIKLVLNRNGNIDTVGHNIKVKLTVQYEKYMGARLSFLTLDELFKSGSPSNPTNSTQVVNFTNTSVNSLTLDFLNIPLTPGYNSFGCELEDEQTGSKTLCEDDRSYVSNLRINYTGSIAPIYSFWSPVFQANFYTQDMSMIYDTQLMKYWTFGGIRFFASDAPSGDLNKPVHRFWSDQLKSHFYTLDDSMKNNPALNKYWKYEGVAFYASATNNPSNYNLQGVYKFWSPQLTSHLYLISSSLSVMNNKDIKRYWTWEGIAFYAFEK